MTYKHAINKVSKYPSVTPPGENREGNGSVIANRPGSDFDSDPGMGNGTGSGDPDQTNMYKVGV